MRTRTRYRRKSQARQSGSCRALRRENRRLKVELEGSYQELEKAYQLLLLGNETDVLREELKNRILDLEKVNLELTGAYRELREFTFGIMKTLGELVEGRDAATAGHCERLVTYSLAIAQELGLGPEHREALQYGGYMHDIGKVAIPDAILLKPGRLTEDEYAYMKEHVILGWKLMSNMPAMEEAGKVVLHHHERFNGTGYPYGLIGEHIPMTARVLALADVFDALITRRPYKEPFPLDDAFEMIRQDTGSHFDPLVVDAFFRALAKGTLNPEIEDGYEV